MQDQHADLAIIGGGIAGLWTLRRAVDAGYNAVLFEAGALGCGQTLASQGMIHGGLKYALSGALTGASEAISTMPARWRDCLAGRGEIDLSNVRPLSERYYLFAGRSTLGRLASFFASKSLRGRITQLEPSAYPEAFRGFTGTVHELEDLVIDVVQLLHSLAEPVRERIYQATINATNCERSERGFRFHIGDTTLTVGQVVSCAGAGAQPLHEALGVTDIPMQRRPLRQVVVHHCLAHPIYAHCLTNIAKPEPRLTITTHGDTFYLGGALATQGATRSEAEQIQVARRELAQCLPWLNLEGAQISTLYVDRAEPAQSNSLRPDEAFVARSGSFIQCWPTKLTLAPDATSKVLDALRPPGTNHAPPTLALPHAKVGKLPWT